MENSKPKREQNSLECPACRFNIKFTIEDLITKKNITCPSCHLSMELDIPIQMKRDPQEILLVEKIKRQFSVSNKSKNETND